VQTLTHTQTGEKNVEAHLFLIITTELGFGINKTFLQQFQTHHMKNNINEINKYS
jgi:hypothetical protein